jgi:peptidoglycan biosynthesis protein MviN/MurJ (putative lipid II flippase)
MPRQSSVASNAAITSISQAAAMVSGGLLAVVVAAIIGNDARTDGFFAAFAVYALIVAFAQSSRTTVVARMLEGRERFTALDSYFGAALMIFLLVSVIFGALASPVAELLTGDLPDAAARTARHALLILWPAAGLQLFAAFGASMLGALGDFLWAGAAFVAGSLLSIAAFLALQPALGIDALAAGMLIGSVLSAAIVAVGLVREGWRPSRTSVTEPRESLRGLGVLTISSISFVIAQLGYLVLLGVGARLGVGVVTAFTYAYMAMSLIQAIFVASVPMVMAAPLAQTWDRRPEWLVPHNEAVFSAGLLLAVPVVASASLIGADVGRLVLADFSDHEIILVIELFLILSVNVVWGLAATVPYAAAVAVGRYAQIALTTAAVVAVQVGMSLLAGALDSVHLLAAVIPASAFFSMLGTMLIVSRSYPRLAFPRLGVVALRLFAAGAVAFAAPAAIANALDLPEPNLLAFAVGLPMFALIVAKLLPVERDMAGRLAKALPVPRLGVASSR